MVFKHFSIRLIARVVLLTLFIAAFLYSLLSLRLIFSSVVLAMLAMLSMLEIIRFVNRTNREMTHFLDTIRYRDFTARYPETGTGKSSDALHEAFNLILGEYRKLQFEKELHARFLNSIVETVPVGILCIDRDEKIILYNHAAKKIVGVNHLPNLSQLKKLVPDLVAGIESGNNERPEVIHLKRSESRMDISLRVHAFKMEDQFYRIVSLQNIKGELELFEVEAWQKLIRVLTHEIMNSVTPISSLSGTLSQMMEDPDDDILDDLRQGIEAIRNRSKGLLQFVEHYRKFTRIPDPDFRSFEVSLLFERLKKLIAPESPVVFAGGEGIFITADGEQLEQVLINLINNALDAVDEQTDPRVEVLAEVMDGKVSLVVKDNGKGIAAENREKIFVPFFTTKENGSGIGLSISRQILLRNKAGITFRNRESGGTEFRIRF